MRLVQDPQAEAVKNRSPAHGRDLQDRQSQYAGLRNRTNGLGGATMVLDSGKTAQVAACAELAMLAPVRCTALVSTS